MNKIKQLTAHIRLMHQRGQIITDSDDFATALNQIDIASESQPLLANKAVDEWIEIKSEKDLPKKEDTYWIYDEVNVTTAYFINGRFVYTQGVPANPTHYQPINKPQPPKQSNPPK